MRRVGLVLVVLGIAAEVLAVWAHCDSRDFAPGMFTWLVWLMMITAPIPVLIGSAVLVRSRNGR